MHEAGLDIVDKYFLITEKALKKVKIAEQKEIDFTSAAKDFLDMARRYFDDASYFRDKGDIARAYAAVSYAHAWLDAGARLGLFDFGKDNELFAAE